MVMAHVVLLLELGTDDFNAVLSRFSRNNFDSILSSRGGQVQIPRLPSRTRMQRHCEPMVFRVELSVGLSWPRLRQGRRDDWSCSLLNKLHWSILLLVPGLSSIRNDSRLLIDEVLLLLLFTHLGHSSFLLFTKCSQSRHGLLFETWQWSGAGSNAQLGGAKSRRGSVLCGLVLGFFFLSFD